MSRDIEMDITNPWLGPTEAEPGVQHNTEDRSSLNLDSSALRRRRSEEAEDPRSGTEEPNTQENYPQIKRRAYIPESYTLELQYLRKRNQELENSLHTKNNELEMLGDEVEESQKTLNELKQEAERVDQGHEQEIEGMNNRMTRFEEDADRYQQELVQNRTAIEKSQRALEEATAIIRKLTAQQSTSTRPSVINHSPQSRSQNGAPIPTGGEEDHEVARGPTASSSGQSLPDAQGPTASSSRQSLPPGQDVDMDGVGRSPSPPLPPPPPPPSNKAKGKQRMKPILEFQPYQIRRCPQTQQKSPPPPSGRFSTTGRPTFTTKVAPPRRYVPCNLPSLPSLPGPVDGETPEQESEHDGDDEDEDLELVSGLDNDAAKQIVSHTVKETLRRIGRLNTNRQRGSNSRTAVRAIILEQQAKIFRDDDLNWKNATRKYFYLGFDLLRMTDFSQDSVVVPPEMLLEYLIENGPGPKKMAEDKQPMVFHAGSQWKKSPWNEELVDVLVQGLLTMREESEGRLGLVDVEEGYIEALFRQLLERAHRRYQASRPAVDSADGEQEDAQAALDRLQELDSEFRSKSSGRTMRNRKFRERAKITERVKTLRVAQGADDAEVWIWLHKLVELLTAAGMSSEELVQPPLGTPSLKGAYYLVKICHWRAEFITTAMRFIDGYAEIVNRSSATRLFPTKPRIDRKRHGVDSNVSRLVSLNKPAQGLPINFYEKNFHDNLKDSNRYVYKLELRVNAEVFQLIDERRLNLESLTFNI